MTVNGNEPIFNIGMINSLINFRSSRSIKRQYAEFFISELAEETHFRERFWKQRK
jgi:hypothetical protein